MECGIVTYSTGVMRKIFSSLAAGLVARSQLLPYGLFVAGILYVVVNYLLPPTFGEVRDRALYYSLPLVFEAAFLASAGLTIALRQLTGDRDPPSGLLAGGIAAVDVLVVISGCFVVLLDGFASATTATVLLSVAALELCWRQLSRHRVVRVIEYVLAALLILAMFKAQALSSAKNSHHWSYYLGPIHSVLDGGKLLWTVPSQYGFLVVLVPALLAKALGIGGTDAFGLVVMFLQFLFTCFLFLLLTVKIRLSPLVAAAAACAVSLFCAGWLPIFEGPIALPSASAARFLPALVALLSVERASRSRSTGWIALASAAVLVSSAWGFESLVYTVGPACAFLGAKAVFELDFGFMKKSPFLPLILGLGGAAAVLVAYSLTGVVGFDLRGFSDYAMQYVDVIGTKPIIFEGWTTFFVFFLAFSYFFARAGLFDPARRNISGILFFAYLWLISSYYVARSHTNNVLNLCPWALLVMALCAPIGSSSNAARAHRVGVATVAILFLNYTFLHATPQNRSALYERLFSTATWIRPELLPVPEDVKKFVLTNSNAVLLGGEVLVTPIEHEPQTGHRIGVSPISHLMVLHPNRYCEYFKRMLAARGNTLAVCHPRAVDIFVPFAKTCPGTLAIKELAPVGEWKVYEMSRPS